MVRRGSGLAAWLAALLLAILQTSLQSFPSAFEPELRETFALRATGFALLASSFQLIYIPAQLAAGMLLDRYRPERLLLFAALAGAVLATGVAHAPTAGSAALMRGLSGLVGSVAFPGCLAIAAARLDRATFPLIATASEGLALTGAAFAQAALPTLAGDDWRRGALLLAALLLASAGPLVVVVRQSPTPASRAASLPPAAGPVLRDPRIWLMAVAGGLLASVPFGFGTAWAPNLVAARFDLDPVASASASSWIFVGVALGAPLLGFLAGKGARRAAALILAPVLVTGILTWVVYGPEASPSGLAVLFVALGFAASAYSLVFARVAEIVAPEATATAMGFTNFVMMAIGACVLAPLYGSVLDWLADGATTVGAFPDPEPEVVIALQRAMVLFLAAPVGAFVLFVGERLLVRDRERR